MANETPNLLTFMQRILKARKDILESGISKDKSGFKFKYIDLPQIETKVNEACCKYDIFCWFDFTNDLASLTLYDALESEPASCFSVGVNPKDVEMKTQPIQDTGAMITYMRRYLYMSAFMISEHDRVDSVIPETTEEEAVQNTETELDPEKKKLIDQISAIDPKAPEKMLTMQKKESLNDLELEYLQKILAAYQTHAAVTPAPEAANV